LIGCDQPKGHLKENVPFPLYCKMDEKEKEKEKVKTIAHFKRSQESTKVCPTKNPFFFLPIFCCLYTDCAFACNDLK
jgi:hypothetical protein